MTNLPLGKPPSFNRIPQILAHEIAILSSGLLRLFPNKARLTSQRLPVELDQFRGTLVSDKAERVHAKSINVAERPRDPVSSHRPHQGMQCARLLTKKVPGGIMRSGSLGNLIIAPRLDGVDQIREQDRVLDEEDWNVVSNQI